MMNEAAFANVEAAACSASGLSTGSTYSCPLFTPLDGSNKGVNSF